MGGAIANAGDVNGDRVPDLIVATGWDNPSASGAVFVYALDPYLHTSAREVSYSSSMPLQLDLAFPQSQAGSHYALLLSATGTGPSSFHGLQIPLTQDTTFQQFLGSPSLLGVLDANAEAHTSLSLHPQTPPSAIGRTLHLAAVTFDTGTQAGRVSSIVRYLSIVP